MQKIKRINISGDYHGGINIKVILEDDTICIFDTTEAIEFLTTQLQKNSFTLDLKPQQKYYRIKTN